MGIVFSFGKPLHAFKYALHHRPDIFIGIEGGVGTEQYIGEGPQDGHIVLGKNIAHAAVIVQAVFIFQYIQGSGSDLSGTQGSDQGFFIDELAAGGIDDDGILLHLSQGFIIDQVVVGGGRIGMEGDDIAFLQQGIQIGIGAVLSDSVIGIEIIGKDAAAEAGKMFDDGGADLSRADDADCTGADVAAQFSLQGVVLHFGPFEDVAHLSQCHHH